MLRQIFSKSVARCVPGNRDHLTVGFARMLERQNFSLMVAAVLGTPFPLEGVAQNARISGDTRPVFVVGKCRCTRIGTSSRLETDHSSSVSGTGRPTRSARVAAVTAASATNPEIPVSDRG